jgi:methyl-accepting chemotaxis protein
LLGIVLTGGLSLLVARGLTQRLHAEHDLGVRNEEQAIALDEAAASMERLGTIVRRNADNALRASRLALDASAAAVNAGDAAGQAVSTMKSINDGARKIADVVGVIDGIAFQTDMLALNAAVEAARAGEHGRGFAVVASEVRSLAQRSAQAANEIKGLISVGVERMEHGTALVDRAGQTMLEIVAAIEHANDMLGEVGNSIDEQDCAVLQRPKAGETGRAFLPTAAPVAPPARAAAVVTDRRGPNRAKNVTRLAPRADPVLQEFGRATGTDDEWTTF